MKYDQIKAVENKFLNKLYFDPSVHTPGRVVHWKRTVRICSMDDRWQSAKVQKTVHFAELSKSTDDVR